MTVGWGDFNMKGMMMSDESKLPLCRGCRDDYYNDYENHAGHSAGGRCWLLVKAQVVERFRIGWWTQPTSPTAYRKVVTLDCHRAPGQYAHHEDMPGFFPGLSRVRSEEPLDVREKETA